ncbi:MAG: hypothetical protein ACR2NU_04120 [Aeoliella sp.]
MTVAIVDLLQESTSFLVENRPAAVVPVRAAGQTEERLRQSVDFLDHSFAEQDAASDDAQATLPSKMKELRAEISSYPLQPE